MQTRLLTIGGLHISAGWMDCFANFCDPGQEFKETLESGSNAAAAGGFTQVMLIPNTQPAVYNKSQVEYLVQKKVNCRYKFFLLELLPKMQKVKS